jgi:hypothetical protein
MRDAGERALDGGGIKNNSGVRHWGKLMVDD